MIDSAILTIIPPIIASGLAYVVANKRAKIQYAKTVSSIQYKAIEVVSSAEQKMREEIREDLMKVREENEKLREEIIKLHHKLEDSDELIKNLRAEILSLKFMVDNYKEQLSAMKSNVNPIQH